MRSGQRWDAICRRVPEHSLVRGAEVGVWQGRLSEELLHRRMHLHLWLIDRWCVPPPDDSYAHSISQMAKYPQSTFDKSKAIFEQRMMKYNGRAHVLVAESLVASRTFNDAYFDFVFLDADHSYEGVSKDIEAWLPKVKSGGWIGGHDWMHHGTDDSVKRAVIAAFSGSNLELDVGNTWFHRVP